MYDKKTRSIKKNSERLTETPSPLEALASRNQLCNFKHNGGVYLGYSISSLCKSLSFIRKRDGFRYVSVTQAPDVTL